NSRARSRKPPGGSSSSTMCGKSRSFMCPVISNLQRVICPHSSSASRLTAGAVGFLRLDPVPLRAYALVSSLSRATRSCSKFLRTRLGRIIRDIRRKIEGNTALEDRFGPLLDLALRVQHQEQRQRGPKVYSLHAPEVECIGRGKARAPYEFGCKVSI